MSTPTYTVTEDHSSCVVLCDGIFNSRYAGIKAANREARRLNLIAKGEEMLALLVESKKNETVFNAETVSWPARRDALIAKITGKQT